jgi:proteic killer suppression protein
MEILVSNKAIKALEKAPKQVQTKFLLWRQQVRLFGLEAVRQIPSFHDEPLKGKRQGQRSVRLNKQWRAIYEMDSDGALKVYVLEVTPHDYRV